MSDELAVLVKVADGVTAQLAAALEDGWFEGLQFTPERSYADWLDDELEDLDCLKVDVVPVAYDETDLEGRGSCGYLVSVDIGVRLKFGLRDQVQGNRIRLAEVDRLILFVQELHEYFIKAGDGTGIGRRLESFPGATWRESRIRTTFSRRHLRDKRMFLGVIRGFWDVSKEL
ncbi:hypothetical protein NA78x_001726 [Anatilimnocola sp. NA78]|uniref:hypothetical protein n=1 Tax=Anatilimnocola sp. NA78 TaxID=3415683 RepID=UPI003CE53077